MLVKKSFPCSGWSMHVNRWLKSFFQCLESCKETKQECTFCSKSPVFGDGLYGQNESTLQSLLAILSYSVKQMRIHETFYDLFNQRFTCIDHPEHGKLFFTNIAIGPHVKPSKVDPHFQCVVVIKKSEQHCTPAPFLNRFEKYALSHQILLQDVLDSYPKQLRLLIDAAIEKVICMYLTNNC